MMDIIPRRSESARAPITTATTRFTSWFAPQARSTNRTSAGWSPTNFRLSSAVTAAPGALAERGSVQRDSAAGDVNPRVPARAQPDLPASP